MSLGGGQEVSTWTSSDSNFSADLCGLLTLLPGIYLRAWDYSCNSIAGLVLFRSLAKLLRSTCMGLASFSLRGDLCILQHGAFKYYFVLHHWISTAVEEGAAWDLRSVFQDGSFSLEL